MLFIWYGYQDMQEWREMSGQTRWWKREVDETSQRQTLTWDQHSSSCSSSLCGHSTRNLRRPTGTANWHLRCCDGQLSSGIPPGVPRQAQRAIHKRRLNRLTSTALYQALTGQITAPICPHCGNGEETAEHLLLSKMGSRTPTVLSWLHWHNRTVTIWWNSSSLQGICPPHVGTAWWTHHDNNNNKGWYLKINFWKFM